MIGKIAGAEALLDEMEEAQPSRGGLSALCAVCGRVLTLTKAGLVRTHGPFDNRCPGSRAPPAASGAYPSSPPEDEQAQQLPAQWDEVCSRRVLSRPRVKPMRRIQCASRELAAKKLASIIEAVVANPTNTPSWDRLFHFSSRCL